MVIKDRACKILCVSRSGCFCRGGHYHFVGADLFTGGKREELVNAADMITVPVMEREEMEVLDITDDGFLTLMQRDGVIKEGVKMANEKAEEDIRNAWKGGEGEKGVFVIVVSVLGEEAAVGVKENSLS